MAINQKLKNIRIENNGNIFAEYTTFDDIAFVAGTHIDSFYPGQDVTTQPVQVQSIATLTWTPEVIAAYKDSLPTE